MKRFLIAGLLALAVTAASQQQASAWCKFNFSAGFNISYESSGSCFTWGCSYYSPPCPYPGCYAPPAYYGGWDASHYAAAYAAHDSSAYAYGSYGGYSGYGSTPQAPAANTGQGYTQQVGYQFYPQYGGQAPGYWYGR
jgi:hypothetical protein